MITTIANVVAIYSTLQIQRSSIALLFAEIVLTTINTKNEQWLGKRMDLG
jgi:hypothetical protein